MKMLLSHLIKNSIPLLCILMFALSLIFVPHYASHGNLYNLLLSTSLFGILAVAAAFTLITGAIDFSLGYQVALYSILVCYASESIGFWPAAALTLLAGCIVGTFNALAINILRANSMVVTLGTMMVVRGIASIISTNHLISCSDATLKELFSFSIGGVIPLTVLLFIAIVSAGYVFLRYTKSGISLYIVGGNANAAHIAGIQVASVRVIAFMLSGLLIALGGILFASRLNTGSVSIGENMTMTILSSCVIGGISIGGGKGSLLRLVFGVFLIQNINNLMLLSAMPASAQLFITGMILILVLIIDRISRSKNAKRGLIR